MSNHNAFTMWSHLIFGALFGFGGLVYIVLRLAGGQGLGVYPVIIAGLGTWVFYDGQREYSRRTA